MRVEQRSAGDAAQHRAAHARAHADSPQRQQLRERERYQHRIHPRRMRERYSQRVECPYRGSSQRSVVVEHFNAEREHQRQRHQRKNHRRRAQRNFAQPENPRVVVQHGVVENLLARIVQHGSANDRADARFRRRQGAVSLARAERVGAKMIRIDKSCGDENRCEDCKRPARRSVGHRDCLVRHRARYTGFHARARSFSARAQAS